nr:hypothetical protein [Tanacetum cinerariifolium]
MENKPNVAGSGPAWLFDIDSLSQTLNYHPILAENQTNSHTGLQDSKKAGEEGTQTYVLFLVLSDGSTNPKNNKDAHTDENEHDDDIQKFVSLDFHSSSCGDQSKEQDDVGAEADINNMESIISTRVWQEELEIKVKYYRCSMKTFIPACLHAFFLKKSPKESIKISRIQVRLKPCKKSSFSSKCRK